MKRSLVVFVLLVGMLFVGSPAQASWLCDYRISCGEVTVLSGSDPILTTANWRDKSPRHYVYSGRDSYRDTDGFYVPHHAVIYSYVNGRLGNIYMRPGWYKISDLANAHLKQVN